MDFSPASQKTETIQLEDFDRHFANFISRLADSSNDYLKAAAILLSSLTRQGHVCLDLSSYSNASLNFLSKSKEEIIDLPSASEWAEHLRQSKMVGSPGEFCPFILDSEGRLYLHRYWQYENDLARFACRRFTAPLKMEFDWTQVRKSLRAFFPDPPGEGADWQRMAALAALSSQFLILTGGPGTGKTTTAVKILLFLLTIPGENIRSIALAAPTGKAATRLKQAVQESLSQMSPPQPIQDRIPLEVFTLHRLLGAHPDSVMARYNESNPLPYDLVLVDEASMIDLSLMSRLTQAVSDSTRLILLGDKDQLASIEPGRVFGDLTRGGNSPRYSNGFRRLVCNATDERIESAVHSNLTTNSIVHLQKNYRFSANSGIYMLSRAVNRGDEKEVLGIIANGSFPDLCWTDVKGEREFFELLQKMVLEHYGPACRVNSAEEAASAFPRFRILSPLRQGPRGVERLNRMVEGFLDAQKILKWHGGWYQGQSIMVSQNHYQLKLFNGDVGFVFWQADSQENESESHQVFFPKVEGGFRRISPLRLPSHEPVWAMTVHKSQGSEFDEILLILPDRFSPLLSRELIYTALTRARRRIHICGNPEIFCQAVRNRVERHSGLSSQLEEMMSQANN